MTPAETNIVKCLVAVAWADGKLEAPESGMIDGLLWAFGADAEEEAAIREYASTPRTLKEALPEQLSKADSEVLLAHAALLTHADGQQSQDEKEVLKGLIKLSGLSVSEAKPIIDTARARASKLASRL